MSEDSDSRPYRFPGLEHREGALRCRRGASSCGSVTRGASGRGATARLHRAGGRGRGGSDLGPPAEDDVEMKSSGSSGSGTESHGNESHGNGSTGSSNGNSKDSALLESSGSNKSSSLSAPGSSIAFSVLSSEQDNPSTSGCSSEESAKAKTQKELLKTLKALRQHLPSERRKKDASATLNTLEYALRCVKQVEANEEYYQLLRISDNQPLGLDVSSYTIEEIDGITSEYTLKNNDTFAVAVSLVTGRIVYVSEQAASVLDCKRDALKDAKFVEFLMPQDVSVFYSFTTPYRLPSWGACPAAESSSPPDCTREKSFFCRIRGGKEGAGGLQYYPFRMMPYLMKVRDGEHADDQFCCLLLAERLRSGYDAPRIPTDRRIFTTTHTPTGVFQDVDERAVPLLGYLPQDLIGTPVLLHLHPSDRPVMLGIHRKILQCSGQPIDHSIRFCARNGEYIILDTSWSSFVNPWSRKVSFVIGRHKVRMGPVNEDVFVAPSPVLRGIKTIDSDVPEITEQIHKLLLQPVHNVCSAGYSSMNGNDHRVSATSSGESASNAGRIRPEGEGEGGKAKPRSFQEICKGVHLQKSLEQQLCPASSNKPDGKKTTGTLSAAVVRPKVSAAPLSWREAGATREESRASFQEELAFRDQTVFSYQQISCLDSVIRYLESCNIPTTMKRKCQSASITTSSDEDKQNGHSAMQVTEEPSLLKDQPVLRPLDDADKNPSERAPAVAGTSLPLPLPDKPESVVSITSQCSYSSTIVHVGDKKPQPESEIIEEMTDGSPTPGPPPGAVPPPNQERESYRKLGMTKQVLATHTQKEEQAFLHRFRELRGAAAFKADCSHYLERQRGQIISDAVPAGTSRPLRTPGAAAAGQRAHRGRGGRHKRTRSKRAERAESSDSAASRGGREPPPRPPLLTRGLNQTSWSPSETSQSALPGAYPDAMPAYPLQVYPGAGSSGLGPSPMSYGDTGLCDGAPRCTPAVHPAPYTPPVVTPVLALILPSYVFPQVGGAPPPLPPQQQTFYGTETGVFPLQQPPFAPPAFPGQLPFAGQPAFPLPPRYSGHHDPFAPTAPLPFPDAAAPSKAPATEGPGWRSSSTSPQLFQSRCSSPLQLNLLQLEEGQRASERRDGGALLPTGGQGSASVEREEDACGGLAEEQELQQASLSPPGSRGPLYSEGTPCVCERLSWGKVCSKLGSGNNEASSRGDGDNSDSNSSSSGMMDILLQEDSRSGTGSSATSGSTTGSGSNGRRTSASGTSNGGKSKSRTSASGTSGSGRGSNDSSQYFGSVDSSQKSQQANGQSNDGDPRAMEVVQSERFTNDAQRVLREDREKLRSLQDNQPHFTEEQRRELMGVHPWMRRGGLPKAIDVKVCSCCGDVTETAAVEPPDSDVVGTETEIRGLRLQREAGEGPSKSTAVPPPAFAPPLAL